MTSPTSRSLALLRERGWIYGKVELQIPKTFIKRDLFGCFDYVAFNPLAPAPELLHLQFTDGTNHSKRVLKIQLWEHLDAFLRIPGCKAEVWSWAKLGQAGTRKLWTLRRIRLLRSGGMIALTGPP